MDLCLSNLRPRLGCSQEPRRSQSAQLMIWSPWGRIWSRAPFLTRIVTGCSRCRSAKGPCTGGHPIPGLCCRSTDWSCRGPCAGPVATSMCGSTRPSPTSWPGVPIQYAHSPGSTPRWPRRTFGSMSSAGRTRSRPGGRRTRWRAVRCGRRRPVCGRVHVPPGPGRLEGRLGRAGRAVVRRSARNCSTCSGAPTTCAAWASWRCRERTIWRDCPTF